MFPQECNENYIVKLIYQATFWASKGRRIQQDGLVLHTIAYHNINRDDAMSVKDSKQKSRNRSYISIRFRLHGRSKVYQFLNELAGVNWYLWNAASAKTKKDYEDSGKSKTSQFKLYKWYKAHV